MGRYIDIPYAFSFFVLFLRCVDWGIPIVSAYNCGNAYVIFGSERRNRSSAPNYLDKLQVAGEIFTIRLVCFS